MRSGVLKKYFLSYVAILIVPIIISCLLYFKYSNIIQNESTRANLSILKQFKRDMDEKLMGVKSLAMEISINKKLDKFITDDNMQYSESIFAAANIIDELKPYIPLSKFADGFYIYIHDKDTVLTSGSYNTTNFFYNNLYKYENLSLEDWKDMLAECRYGKLLEGYSYNIPDERGEFKKFTYVFPIRFSGTKNQAAVVALFDVNRVKKMLEGLEVLGNACILDSNGNVILSTEPVIGFDMQQMSQKTDGMDMVKKGDKEYILIYTNSTQFPWKYVFIVPKSKFMENSYYARIIMILAITVCIILGLILSYGLARQNYNPVRKLLEGIPDLNIKSLKKNNEFTVIEEAMQDIYREKNKLKESFNRQLPLVRSMLFQRMLKGEMSNSELSLEMLQSYGIEFASNKFMIILVAVNESYIFRRNDAQEWINGKLKVKNIMEDILEQSYNTYFIGIDDDVSAMILNIRKNIGKDEVYEQLKSIIQDAHKFISEELKTIVSVYVSNLHEGIGELTTAYEEAQKVMNYQLLRESSIVTFCNEINGSNDYYLYPPDIQNKVENCVKSGNYKMVDKIISDVFNDNATGRNIDPRLVKCFVYEFVNIAVRISGEIGIEIECIFQNGFDDIDQLLKHRNIESVIDRIKSIYYDICKYIETNKKDHNQILKDKILDYLYSNYNNINLSQTIMAEELDISSSYLSHLFKVYFGENMVDFINRYRIQKAKDIMLSNEKLKLNEIAGMVGFSSDIAFIKTFKKYEMVTPGKYKTNKAATKGE